MHMLDNDLENIRYQIKNAKRIIIKVGTSTLTHANGKINLNRIDKLTRVISDLQNEGRQVILVSSGAIGVGAESLKLKERPRSIKDKQAAAAVGQCQLMSIYSKFFGDYGQTVAQILLTRDIIASKEGVANVVNTFNALMDLGVVPIVNENDSVSTAEIIEGEVFTFNENDTLSAIVTALVEGDMLIILSDIDGFYDCDPRENECSKRISIVRALTPELEACAGGAGSKLGTGGMITKLKAAKIANEAGAHMILANGNDPSVIFDIVEGKDVGSVFVSEKQLIGSDLNE